VLVEEVVDSVAGAAELVLSDGLCAVASVLAAAPVPLLAEAEVAPLPPRKSVTYQPEPFNWKPAAVNCLVNVAAPQAGQTDKGASDIFCSTSLLCPHD
jgi:hypothetical protein